MELKFPDREPDYNPDSPRKKGFWFREMIYSDIHNNPAKTVLQPNGDLGADPTEREISRYENEQAVLNATRFFDHIQRAYRQWVIETTILGQDDS